MDRDQDWYRQLIALVLLAASRAAVEFITNPNSREVSGKQLRSAFSDIDYNALAKAVTNILDDVAETSKGRLSETIDTLHDQSVQAVNEAKSKAEKQLAGGESKSGGGKFKYVLFATLGAVVAYFFFDEQRRDELLDRLTGASGPISQSTQNITSQPQNTTQNPGGPTSGTGSTPQNQ